MGFLHNSLTSTKRSMRWSDQGWQIRAHKHKPLTRNTTKEISTLSLRIHLTSRLTKRSPISTRSGRRSSVSADPPMVTWDWSELQSDSAAAAWNRIQFRGNGESNPISPLNMGSNNEQYEALNMVAWYNIGHATAGNFLCYSQIPLRNRL